MSIDSDLSKTSFSVKDTNPIREEIIENEDGSVTKARTREIIDSTGKKIRTEINSETLRTNIRIDTEDKKALLDAKYNSEEVSIVKKGGKEIITRVRVQKDNEGNITKVTIREIKNKDGSTVFETNVESMDSLSNPKNAIITVKQTEERVPLRLINNTNNKKSVYDQVDSEYENVINLPHESKPETRATNEPVKEQRNEPTKQFISEPIKEHMKEPVKEQPHESPKQSISEPIKIQPALSTNSLIQRKYAEDYQLNEQQFRLIRDYFNRFQTDDLISKSVFKSHLMHVLLVKNKVSANEESIANALHVIDEDAIDLDFDEFIDFMTLFFANKTNLKTRVTNVLNGHQFKHSRKGFLSPDEANYYYDFLCKFYKRAEPDWTQMEFVEDLSYSEFARMVKPVLQDNTFVRS